MVKKYSHLILFLFSLVPAMSFAAEFKARVDRNKIGENDTVHLQIELSDSQAREEPDFSALEKYFRIVSQEQSSSQNIINGTTSSATEWNLTLSPNQPGHVEIPSIAIETNQGELRTQIIAIEVDSESTGAQMSQTQKGISFNAIPAKTEVYRNERVKVVFRLDSARDLRNLQIEPLSVKDAIAEPVGKAQVQTHLVKGHSQQELVVSYFITPLQDGVLTIPPLVIHAEVMGDQTRSSPNQDPFGSFFEDADGSMAGMQKMMRQFAQGGGLFEGFAQSKPAILSSKPISLKVLPAIAGMNPWLPATSLKILDKWSIGEAREGEPLTLTLTTQATGIDATQLPSLEDQLHSQHDLNKVYAEQPKLSSTPASGQINGDEISQRSEIFTIIPQTSGEIKIPSIQLSWWDTNHQVKKVASLPERMIHVLASAHPLSLGQPLAVKAASLLQSPVAPEKVSLAPVLIITAFFVLFLIGHFLKRDKKTSKSETAPELGRLNDLPLGKNDLKKCSDVSEINRFLQLYSEANWQIPANSSLPKIFAAAEAHIQNFDRDRAEQVSKKMEDALYAGQPIDAAKVKETIYGLVFNTERNPRKEKGRETLPQLNPS